MQDQSGPSLKNLEILLGKHKWLAVEVTPLMTNAQ